MPSPVTVSARSPADAGLDTAMLDCWQATLALGLLAQGRGDVLTVLGSQWWFGEPEQPGDSPSLDLQPEADRLERLTGLRPAAHRLDGAGLLERCEGALAVGRVPLVVTDGFVLPWCPYYKVRHVEHSFAVTGTAPGGLSVVDAYDIRTEWGTAQPLDTAAGPDVVAAIEQTPGSRVVELMPLGRPAPTDPVALLRENASALAAWTKADPYAWFTDRYCAEQVDAETFEAFCEICWGIERRRRLYAGWLDTLAHRPDVPLPAGFPDEYRSRVVAAWSEVNRFAYLALRRLRAGRGTARNATGALVTAAAAAERALAADLVGLVGGDAEA